MNNTILPAAQFATRALMYEVTLHPKPGLVDPIDSGAHHDMNIYTFLDSVSALTPYFDSYYEAGLHHRGTYRELFDVLREIGIDAEKDMFKATNHVNTHKGANFSFSVILGATGYYFQKNPVEVYDETDTANILQIVKKMTAHLIQEDLLKLTPNKKLTNGEKLFIEKGRTGIRGEAAAGYPALNNLLLPYFRKNKDLDSKSLLLRGLLLLMSQIEDGNILHRGSEEDWLTIKEESAHILSQTDTLEELEQALIAYNEILKARYLSPGGAADLLALGIYFGLLEELITF